MFNSFRVLESPARAHGLDQSAFDVNLDLGCVVGAAVFSPLRSHSRGVPAPCSTVVPARCRHARTSPAALAEALVAGVLLAAAWALGWTGFWAEVLFFFGVVGAADACFGGVAALWLAGARSGPLCLELRCHREVDGEHGFARSALLGDHGDRLHDVMVARPGESLTPFGVRVYCALCLGAWER